MLAAGALAVGAFAAVHYWLAGLTLSHYDARAHLVVARRILDSLTPGVLQIGGLWLPLPHLLNALPVQIDVFYRTGAFATAMSVACLAVTVWSLARFILRTTGSAAGAAVCAAAVTANPNLLYLSSTPMTEPLLVALTALALWLVARSLDRPASASLAHQSGLAMAAACLTRYEAWAVVAALLGLHAAAAVANGERTRDVLRRTALMAAYPVLALLGFLALSRVSTGDWFVASGFYVPETLTRGRIARSLVAVWWGAHHLTGYPVTLLGAAGLVIAAALALRAGTGRRALLLAAALAAAGALPWYAFYLGHPFRFRYMAPLVPPLGLGLGLLVGVSGRRRAAAAALAVAALLAGPLPFDDGAAVVQESQLDAENRAGRQVVTDYLARHWDHAPVLASMGSLAHYMQELSAIGFHIRDFVHEGNGALWQAALEAPACHVRWLLVEEEAEGGDVLARKLRADGSYLEGFDRVAWGGHVALYRRAAPETASRSAPGRSPGC